MSEGRKGGGRGGKLAEVSSFVLVAVAVWLGWQGIREMASDRLPPSLALRISPTSPRVLARAAEAELVAKRFDNAEYLARESLIRAPFNVPAMRVLGLVEAEQGEPGRADQILTLAGNWSLRDGPTHAWLVEHRLSQGNYGSSFAHADTLARRRADLHPQVFQLFTTAAKLDPRAIPVIAELLAANPPWRSAFLTSLLGTDDGLVLSVNLALVLQAQGDGAFTKRELTNLYTYLMRKGRLEAMAEVRRRLQRPASDLAPVNGEFQSPSSVLPYEWKLMTGPGVVAEILNDDLRPDETALRVQYDGARVAVFAEQLLQLAPGAHRFSGQRRMEMDDTDAELSWTVSCVESGGQLADTRRLPKAAGHGWQTFSSDFVVPSSDCQAQWMRLTGRPGDRRGTTLAWFDKIELRPLP